MIDDKALRITQACCGAALLVVLMMFAFGPVRSSRDSQGMRFEIKRSGEVLEVWRGPELLGEYELKDGEIYEFLRDVDQNRL